MRAFVALLEADTGAWLVRLCPLDPVRDAPLALEEYSVILMLSVEELRECPASYGVQGVRNWRYSGLCVVTAEDFMADFTVEFLYWKG